jgi:hypothetical protein
MERIDSVIDKEDIDSSLDSLEKGVLNIIDLSKGECILVTRPSLISRLYGELGRLDSLTHRLHLVFQRKRGIFHNQRSVFKSLGSIFNTKGMGTG